MPLQRFPEIQAEIKCFMRAGEWDNRSGTRGIKTRNRYKLSLSSLSPREQLSRGALIKILFRLRWTILHPRLPSGGRAVSRVVFQSARTAPAFDLALGLS